MTDNELLELAAKAAGFKFAINGDGLPGYVAASNGDWRFGWCYWSPLADDGDALRLAVKLRLPIRDGLNGTVTTGNSDSGYPIWELYGDDPYAATRRAITRAAAEIGKNI